MARLNRSATELLLSNETRWQQAHSMQALLDLSIGLIGADNLERILEQTILAAAELTQCRRVSIMLPDSKGMFLTIAQCVGLDKTMAGTVRVQVGEGIAVRSS